MESLDFVGKMKPVRILAVGTEGKESKKGGGAGEGPRFNNKINISSKRVETKVKDNPKVFIWEPLIATKQVVKKYHICRRKK